MIPYPPGGPTDFVGRIVGQKLSQLVGQQVVVDNRPGAGTIIGSELVARAAPDGYTLLFGTGGGTFLAPLMLPKVPYDPLKDFAPVAMLVMSPQVLVVHPSVACEFGERARGAREIETGRAQFRIGRQRHVTASRRRALAIADRHEDRSRSLKAPRPR